MNDLILINLVVGWACPPIRIQSRVIENILGVQAHPTTQKIKKI